MGCLASELAAPIAASQRHIDRAGTRGFTRVGYSRNPVVRRLGLPDTLALDRDDLLAFAIVAGQKYVIVVRAGRVIAAVPTDKYGGLLAFRVSPP